MRTRQSINNIVFGIGGNIISSLLTFASRTVFINTLGTTYLGVNGLLTNILSMLSLTELGVGTAISFSLYKPIAEKNNKKIAGLMNFYKKAYRYIGIFVFISGLILLPFLKYIIKDYKAVDNLNIIYLLYLINTAYSYLFTYKRTLITADQKAYKLVPFTTISKIITIIIQIVVLLTTNSFIFYLIIQILTSFLENIFINKYINKKYLEVCSINSEKIDGKELKIIIKNIKAMMLHKVGDFCINSTDNIIISAFVNIISVGIYSNYLMIINMINQFIMIFFNSLTASVGNLIAKEGEEKNFQIFKVIDFIGFWIYSFVSICFYNLMNPFITLWIGNNNLLSKSTVAVIVANYYFTGMRVPVSTVKGAAGLYDDDKYIPIIQSVINLFISIILVQGMGIIGVFIGTLISSIILPCWYRPIIIYKKVFKLSSRDYFTRYFKYLIIVILNIIVSSMLINILCRTIDVYTFVIMIIICICVPNIINVIIFRKTQEFKYILNIIKNILWRKDYGKKS